MNTQERKNRIIARGEFSNHCHVVTGEVQFDSKGRIVVSEDSNAILKHLLETDWVDGKETWTGEHTDIKLTPGVYEYEPWSKEKTGAQIEKAKSEKIELCRELNDICSTIRYWLEEKKIIGMKISNKDVYINQLKEQLNESDWQEV